jgi:hypothetical protein
LAFAQLRCANVVNSDSANFLQAPAETLKELNTVTVFLCWVVLVASLFSAHICCKRLLRTRDRTIFFLSVMVLWITLLIVSVQFLGELEIVGIISRVTLPGIALLQLVVLGGAATLSFARRPLTTLSFRDFAAGFHEKFPFYLKLSSIILGGSYLLFAINLCTSFPNGTDALSYHMPLALRWLQEGSLRISSDKAWQFSLPGNGEIVEMLALATGKQFLVPLGSWVASIVLATAAYSLAVRFSNGAKAPAFSAILVVFSIPMVEFQAFSAYVDIFGTAFLFAAVTVWTHRYHSQIVAERTTPVQSLSLGALAVSGLACGVSLGTKTTFLPYCAMFLAGVIYILWKERHIHKEPVSLLVGIFLVGVLLPSAFWNVRALQATGNPVYPIPVSLGTHEIFTGFQPATKLLVNDPPGGPSNQGDNKFVRHVSEWLIYPWTEWLNSFGGDFPTVYGEASGLGGAFATFVVVGVGFVAYQCASGSGPPQVLGATRTVLLGLSVSLLIWVFAMHRVLRFGLPIWIFACLLAAPAFALLMKACPRASAVLFVCAISTTCAINSLVPFHEFAGNLLSWRWSRSAIYAYPGFIDELPPGTCILNDSPLREKNFPLAGSKLSNKVVTNFEAPQEITPGFISSRKIDYIVQIAPIKNTADSSLAALPESVASTEVFHATQLALVWRIWKVGTRDSIAEKSR